jgi:uncharacterized protein DUF4123
LAFSNDEVLALEVEGHLLELRRREVVSERYLDQDPTWLGRAGPGDPEARLQIKRQPLGDASYWDVAREVFGERALALFLPSRAPKAWASCPEEAPSRGPFPLWAPSSDLPLECVPHLIALGQDPFVESLQEELQPLDFVILESAAQPLALAGFLGQLRWAYVEGRALGLRFYDPRVLPDLWAHLDASNLGLLFGGGWTRDEGGREDLRCVLCDAELAALSRRCSGCGAPLLGEDEAPALIGAQALVAERELVIARPQTKLGERRALARRPLPGRKAFWLAPSVVAALGGAYRARVEAQVGSEGATPGAKT